ncbi:MAG: S8 family serine peptidase [Streptosporangiaceae bacterium]
MARWSCDDKTVGTGRGNGAGSPAGRSRDPANGQHAAGPPSRGDVTAVSPRLPSGALLAITVAMTAATTVLAALPARAARAAPGHVVASRAAMASQTAADKIRDQEWWLANLHVSQAWAVTRGAGVTVAVLSSGVDAGHPDLTGSVITGADFTGSGETPATPSWGIEGTSAASIVAGHGDNAGDAAGISGVAPAARILSVRVVLDATDPLNANPAAVQRLPTAIAAGIRYAAAHGAQVIDLPLDPASLASDGAATGGLGAAAGGSAAEQAAVDYALGKGAVLVAPAGDNGEDGNVPTYPAAYPGVIAVGTVDRHFVRAPFSNRQSYVALTAPGVDLTTASPPSGYRNMSTTDAASAVVAGIAALIRSRYPTLNSSQVRQALVTGSVPRPPSATGAGYGAGTVDALRAVQAAALIAAPRASPSASASAPAAAPAPPRTIRPAPPRTGILSRATAVLRDAAMAAGMLILLLLASLIGIRVRRRRADRGPLPGPEPWTLLNAPPGPPGVPAGVVRYPRATAGARSAGRVGAPGTAPWRTGPARPDWQTGAAGQDTRPPAGARGQTADTEAPAGRARPGAPPAPASGPPPGVLPVPGTPPLPGTIPGRHSSGLAARPGMAGSVPATDSGGGPASDATAPGDAPSGASVPGRRAGRRARNRGRGGQSAAGPRTGAHGLQVRVTPVSRTVPRAQVTPPGGPPWEPAPRPEGELPHDTAQRVPDPFASFARPSPRASAPWDVAASGPPLRRGQFTSPGGPALPGAGPASIPGPVPPPGPQAAEAAGRPASWYPADPQGPVTPLGRLRSAGPVPPVDPGFPGGPVPPRRAAPPGMSPEGWLPLIRPSGFAESSGPAGPGHPAGPPDTPAGRSAHGMPAPPPGRARPAPVSPPDQPAGGAARPRRSPYSGRHAAADGPGGENGPTGAAGPGRDGPSGPLYIWNPAALTQPFPPAPPPRGEPEPPAGDTGQQP